ncbi:MAG: hypothetical protein WC358_03455, partial [Ignavibacteria bacterium]
WLIGGENTAFWRPMGVAIIFGLIVSTFLTLVITPTLYAVSDDLFQKFKFWEEKHKKYKVEPGTEPVKESE